MQRLRLPLVLLVAASGWMPAHLAAEPTTASAEANSALYGVFISMPEGGAASTARSSIVSSPALSSGVPTADFLRALAGSEYAVHPGDLYALTLVYYAGSTGDTVSLSLELFVEEDYTLQLPLAGAISVRGKTLGGLRAAAIAKLRQSVAVVHVDVWLQTPATFTVFVAGAVNTPGYVSANGLMRVSDALQRAGGLLEGASLRTISVRRGAEERLVDLLRFASGRDTEGNPRLESGDMVVVPAARTGAQVTGSVRYPGSYELVEGETLSDLLELAGGLSSGADARALTVTRIDGSGAWAVTRVSTDAHGGFEIRDGDLVTVPSGAQNAPMVTAEGALFGKTLDPAVPSQIPDAPLSAQIAYFPGLTVLRVLELLGGPTPYAVGAESFVIRERSGEKVRFDATALWRSRDARVDFPLEPGDRVVVPLQTLNVAVRGEVTSPGIRTYIQGYTVADYVRASGGAHPTRGALHRIRLTTAEGVTRRVEVDYEPAAGDSVEIGKQPVAALSDAFSAYVFPITGIVVGVLSVATAILNFVARVDAITN